MSDPRPFYIAAALCAAAGLALRFAPASPGRPASEPAARPAVAAAQPVRAGATLERYAAVVSANAFSPSRKPPATRLVPEGMRRDTQPAVRAPRKPAEPRIRLFGITRGPGGAVALIDADPAVPGAEVYRVGDEVLGGRVREITDSTVVLMRSSERLVLRLPTGAEDAR